MGTPFIGQHDKAQVSTILFLTWLNTCLLGSGMDESTINLLLGIFFIVVVPVMTLVAVEIFEEDDDDKRKDLKW